jgi:hypothetical protein
VSQLIQRAFIGGKESDDIAHIVRLDETLQRLNAKREVGAR